MTKFRMSSNIRRILLVIRIIRQEFIRLPVAVCISSVGEVRAFSQSITSVDRRIERIDKLVIGIAYGLIVTINLSLTDTNLATFYLHQRIAKHTSELTTTDDGFHDKGCAANGHISASYV